MDAICDPSIEDCKLSVPDMIYAAYADLHDEIHDAHIVRAIETEGVAQGMIWYLLAPLGAGSIPILFHYFFRTQSYFTTITDTSGFYSHGWWVLWIGNVAINGIVWIFQLIATFGGATDVNVWVWFITKLCLGTLHFFTVLALYTFAGYTESATGSAATLDIILDEATLYIAIYALEMLEYSVYFKTWMNGNLRPKYWAIKKAQKAEQEDV